MSKPSRAQQLASHIVHGSEDAGPPKPREEFFESGAGTPPAGPSRPREASQEGVHQMLEERQHALQAWRLEFVVAGLGLLWCAVDVPSNCENHDDTPGHEHRIHRFPRAVRGKSSIHKSNLGGFKDCSGIGQNLRWVRSTHELVGACRVCPRHTLGLQAFFSKPVCSSPGVLDVGLDLPRHIPPQHGHAYGQHQFGLCCRCQCDGQQTHADHHASGGQRGLLRDRTASRFANGAPSAFHGNGAQAEAVPQVHRDAQLWR